MKQPNKNALYILEESPYGNNEQVVLHVTNKFKEGYICFDDTNRGHMIRGNIVGLGVDWFLFLDENKREWKFKEVSIESFQERVYRLVVGGEEIKQHCNTTEELWKYFRMQFPI